MEKKDVYATPEYPTNLPTSAPPAGFTPAVQYPGTSKGTPGLPMNFTPAQVVISTQPPIQPTTSQNYNPRYPPQYIEESSGCFNKNQKNKPQSNSVGAVATIFISGGMNIAWSCLYTAFLQFPMTIHLRVCWFVAAIIGASCSAVVTNYVPKKLIYLFSSVLVIVGGVLFISMPHDSSAITAALYMDGIGNGAAIVPMLVMAGEETIPGMRGTITSLLELMCFTCGMFIQITVATSYGVANVTYSSFGATELHGLLSIIYGVVAFLIAAFLVIESPVYYLQRDDEDRAIDSLRRLQRPFVVTHETYRLLSESKSYVNANRADPYVGVGALLKLCIYRGLVALSFSRYTTYALLITSLYAVGADSTWPYISASILLWLGSFIAAFVMDSAGRKKPMLFGALICGGMAIGIGAIFNDNSNFYYNTKIDAAMYLYLILQFCAGIFASAAPVYSTEAFPLRLKSYYVALAFIVQMLIQIILGACDMTIHGIAGYFITMGVLYFVFFIFGLFAMPETKNDTLREAQDKFKNFLSRRLT